MSTYLFGFGLLLYFAYAFKFYQHLCRIFTSHLRLASINLLPVNNRTLLLAWVQTSFVFYTRWPRNQKPYIASLSDRLYTLSSISSSLFHGVKFLIQFELRLIKTRRWLVIYAIIYKISVWVLWVRKGFWDRTWLIGQPKRLLWLGHGIISSLKLIFLYYILLYYADLGISSWWILVSFRHFLTFSFYNWWADWGLIQRNYMTAMFITIPQNQEFVLTEIL